MGWEYLGCVSGGMILWDGRFRNRFCADDGFSVEIHVGHPSRCPVGSLKTQGRDCWESDLGSLVWRIHRGLLDYIEEDYRS